MPSADEHSFEPSRHPDMADRTPDAQDPTTAASRPSSQAQMPDTSRRRAGRFPAGRGTEGVPSGEMVAGVARTWVQHNQTTALIAAFALGVTMGSAMRG